MTTQITEPVIVTSPGRQTYSVWTNGGIARISDGVAVIAWSYEDTGWYWPVRICLVRFENGQVELGTSIQMPLPPDWAGLNGGNMFYVSDVISGREGEAWLIIEDGWFNERIWTIRVTVDPTDPSRPKLEWKSAIEGTYTGRGAYAAAWPEQNKIIIGSNGGHSETLEGLDPWSYHWVYVVDMDTGELLSYKDAPSYEEGSTEPDFIYEIAFNPQTQTLCLFNDYRNPEGDYEITAWFATVSTLGEIGEWQVQGSWGYGGVNWVSACATPQGFEALATSWGDRRTPQWVSITNQGEVVVRQAELSTNADGFQNYSYQRVHSIAHDASSNTLMMAWMEWGDEWSNYEASPAFARATLPSTNVERYMAVPGNVAWQVGNLMQICRIGENQFLYFFAMGGLAGGATYTETWRHAVVAVASEGEIPEPPLPWRELPAEDSRSVLRRTVY